MATNKVNTKPFWRFLFLVYCGVMLWLLFDRPHDWDANTPYKELLRQNTNLTPFYTIRNYIYALQHSPTTSMRTHCFINLAGNVLLFIPAGWLLPKVWGYVRYFFRFFAVCAGCILLIETVQLFTLLGCFDVDDLILNLSGMTIGFLIFALHNRK